MGRKIPYKYLHSISPINGHTRTMQLDQTHPGFLVLDETGNIISPRDNTNTFEIQQTVYLMDIPHLDCIEKINDSKVKVRFGHRGGEQPTGNTSNPGDHLDSAAYIEVKFDPPGNNSTPFTAEDRPLQKSFSNFNNSQPDQPETYKLTSNKVERMGGTLDFGPDKTNTQRYLVVSRMNSESVTITILAEDSTGPDRPEINCHVNIIGSGPGVACILDPATCTIRSVTDDNPPVTSYRPGDSFTYHGNGEPYWIAPFIVPKVVFEVGDPEPNSKIIIDDA